MKKNPLSTQVCLLTIFLVFLFTSCDKTVIPLPVSGTTGGTANSAAKAPVWLLKKVIKTGPYSLFEKTFFYNAQHQLIRSERKTTDSGYFRSKKLYFSYNSNGSLAYITNDLQPDTFFFQYDAQNRLIAHSPIKQSKTTLYNFNYYYKGNNTIGSTYCHNYIIMWGSAASYRREYVYDAAGNITKILGTSKSASSIGLPPPPPPDTTLVPKETLLTYDNRLNYSRSLQVDRPGILAQDLIADEGKFYPVIPANNITDDGSYYYQYIYNADNLVEQVNVYYKFDNALAASARLEYVRL
ncbi:hypothetical protein [Chitinophaga nivalis]|uniref:YD repeat-containing protein n=1 Tax=Chitinophaga nivalis TaxID=2991709 RepID=A0ABT3IR01_9BACT|nr:hypothetical protein [Chitinophaga nivalis]MCW3463918.1 hypothetical protein [Chitinophaga nivalis]MCW3486392.1 hypothetical protein [Chitinophaga nivalis]